MARDAQGAHVRVSLYQGVVEVPAHSPFRVMSGSLIRACRRSAPFYGLLMPPEQYASAVAAAVLLEAIAAAPRHCRRGGGSAGSSGSGTCSSDSRVTGNSSQ